MAIMRIQFFSQSLKRATEFNLVIPNDIPDMFRAGNPRFADGNIKLLFLLHGFSGNCNDWLTNSQIVSLANKYNLAVVMPSVENVFYVDGKGTGKAYGDYVGRELVDYVRKTFGLSVRREDTFICGLSMGGFGAIRLSLKYNHTFSKTVGLSSALVVNTAKKLKEGDDTGVADYDYFVSVFGDLTALDQSDSNPEFLVKELVRNGDIIPDIYMACGEQDFLINENREFKAYLESNGIAPRYTEGEGVHDWVYWNRHLEPAIRWMLDESEAQ